MVDYGNMRVIIFLLGATTLFCQCSSELLHDKQQDSTVKAAPTKSVETPAGDLPNPASSDTSGGAVKEPEVIETKTESRVACLKPAQLADEPFTIAYVIKLINSLPMPVTIPCVIDVLPRPLAINATVSDLSVQPANGSNNPRIFIKIGSLTMTFAVSGDGSKTIEFGQSIATNRSLKGEIAFPVTNTLLPTAAYDQVKAKASTGTTCAGCHFDESQAGSTFPALAFGSRALRPFEHQAISIDSLRGLKELCTDGSAIRCQVLDAIFNGSVPEQFDFPVSMPTLF